jgi:hypothetical protein
MWEIIAQSNWIELAQRNWIELAQDMVNRSCDLLNEALGSKNGGESYQWCSRAFTISLFTIIVSFRIPRHVPSLQAAASLETRNAHIET